MKSILFATVLALLAQVSFAQVDISGNYNTTGYFFHPSSPRALTATKKLTLVSGNTYKADIGDLGSAGYSFYFTIGANNKLTNFTPIGSTPTLPASGFMTSDNPGAFPSYPDTTTGYLSSIYNNTYNPTNKTLYLHYGYHVGATSQNQFDRQVYEKWVLSPTQPPIIKSINPLGAYYRTPITIKGKYFSSITDTAYAVSFAGTVPDSCAVLSDSVIVAYVGPFSIGKIIVNNGVDTTIYSNFFTALTPPLPQYSGWGYIGNAGFSNRGVFNPSAVCGSNNVPYVCYIDSSSSNSVIVMKYANNNWLQVGTPVSTTTSDAAYLMQDNVNNPIVAYFEKSGAFAVTFKKYTNNTWQQIAKMTSANAININPKVALGKNNQPYVLYLDNTNTYLTLIKYNGVKWDTVGKSSFTTTMNQDYDLAIDTLTNNIYVLYTTPDATNNPQAYVLKYSNNSWTILGNTALTNSKYGAYYLNIKVDKVGNPVVAVQDDNGFERASVFTFKNNAWTTLGKYIGYSHLHALHLSIDKKNNPVLCYQDDSYNSQTSFFSFNSATSSWQYVGPQGFLNTALNNSTSKIFFDTTNTPYLVYADNTNNSKLSVVKYMPPSLISFSPKTATSYDTITIKGKNLTTLSSVTFGGTPAQSFTIVNDSIVKAVVLNGSSGYVKILTNAGEDSLSGFIYCNNIQRIDQQYLYAQADTIIHEGYPVACVATNSSYQNSHFQWLKNNIKVGADTNIYIDYNYKNGDSIQFYQFFKPNGACVDTTPFYTNVVKLKVLPGLPYPINLVAGNGNSYTFSGDNGDAKLAAISSPSGIAIDKKGNIYIADYDNARIRRVDKNGIITTFAGGGQGGDNGPATDALLHRPSDVAFDKAGNLYIAQPEEHVIRMVDTFGIITTVAGDGTRGNSGDGTPAVAAQLASPAHIALDTFGNLFISDEDSNVIRKVNGVTGFISTIAGKGIAGFSGDGGIATYAKLFRPQGISTDKKGNLYIADRENNRIRRVDVVTGKISTVAGGGVYGGINQDGQKAVVCYLDRPLGVAVSADGSLYVTHYYSALRKVDANGILTTVAGQVNYTYGILNYYGDGIPATAAILDYPFGICLDSIGNLYFSDKGNNRVRKVTYFSDNSTIQGTIKTPIGKAVQQVTITCKANKKSTTTSNTNGTYSFAFPKGETNTLIASKNNDKKKANGVSTIDISLIQAHILKKSPLNSSYKLIAADANNDKKITSIDITYIKRLILGLDTTFTGNRLWAFIDSTYKFPDTTNPFPYKDSISFTNLTTNQTNQSFIGVKLGDVNYDWNPTILGQQATTNQPIELYYDTVYTNNTNEIKLHLKANNFKELIGMQFGISFNKAQFNFTSIENNTLGIDFGTTMSKEGQLTFLWNDINNEAKTLANGSELFTLVLHKKDNSVANADLNLNRDITAVEAYDKDYQFHNIIKGSGAIVEKVNPITSIEKETIEVSPNPSNGNIIVTIQSKSEKKVHLNLMELNGKKLLTQAASLTKGNNKIPLSLKVPTGTYYLTTVGLEEKASKQIIIIQ